MTSFDQAIHAIAAIRPFQVDTLATAGTSMRSAIAGFENTNQGAEKAEQLILAWARKDGDAQDKCVRAIEEAAELCKYAKTRQDAGISRLEDAVAVRDAIADKRETIDEMIGYLQEGKETYRRLISSIQAKTGSSKWNMLMDAARRFQEVTNSMIEGMQGARSTLSSLEFDLTHTVIGFLPGHKEAEERQAELRAIEEKLYRDPPSGGCYVATAVYGSYDCPQVWTLRRYRDYGLASSLPGRLFIKLYYAISPTVVSWFGDYRWFNAFWRSRLDRMINRLEEAGYENTPYADRDWRSR